MNINQINDFRLIRIQSDCTGIIQSKNGLIKLKRYFDKSYRNTSHFCVNGIVSEHTFYQNADNKDVVIVADPRQIKAPLSGARLEDIYYHSGKDNELHLGRALIFAPANMYVGDLDVITYPLGKRNETILNYLNSIKVQPLLIGSNQIDGLDITSYYALSKKFVEYAQPDLSIRGPCLLDAHMHTIDGSLEDSINYLSGLLDTVKQTHNSYALFDGTTREVTRYVPERISEYLQQIENYLDTYPVLDNYAHDYFRVQLPKQFQELKDRSLFLNNKYQSRFTLVDSNNLVVEKNLHWEVAFNKILESYHRTGNIPDWSLCDTWCVREKQNLGRVPDVFEYELRLAHVVPNSYIIKNLPPPLIPDVLDSGMSF